MMLRIAVAVREVGFFLLQPRAVAQHDVAEFGRGRRAIHRPAEPFARQHRKIAGMVDMRVREHDRVERVGRDRQRAPVAQPQVLGALERAAVDQHAPVAVLDQVFRAGHGFGRTEKSQFHGSPHGSGRSSESITARMRAKRLMEIRDCRIRICIHIRAPLGRGSSSGRCGFGLTSINARAGRRHDSGRMRAGDVVIPPSAQAACGEYTLRNEITTLSGRTHHDADRQPGRRADRLPAVLRARTLGVVHLPAARSAMRPELGRRALPGHRATALQRFARATAARGVRCAAPAAARSGPARGDWSVEQINGGAVPWLRSGRSSTR